MGSFGDLNCTYKRAHFFGRQCDPVIIQFILGTWVSSIGNVLHISMLFFADYCGLRCHIQRGYWGHMIMMLPSSLCWFPKCCPYKIHQAEKYMLLPLENIARGLLELHFSTAGPPDYSLYIASAPCMIRTQSQFVAASLKFSGDGSAGHLPFQFLVYLQTSRTETYFPEIKYSMFLWWFLFDTRSIWEWIPRITMYKELPMQVRMFIGQLNYVRNHQPQGITGTAVRLLQHLQPTNQLLGSFWSWPQATERVHHYTSYVRECLCCLLSTI